MSETLRVINVTVFKLIVRTLSVMSEKRTARLRFRFNPAGDDITRPGRAVGGAGQRHFHAPLSQSSSQGSSGLSSSWLHVSFSRDPL